MGKWTGQAAGLPRDMTVIRVIPVAAHGCKGYLRGIDDGGVGNSAARFGSEHPRGRAGREPPIERFPPVCIGRELGESYDEPFFAREANALFSYLNVTFIECHKKEADF